jgi:hypothetical protein
MSSEVWKEAVKAKRGFAFLRFLNAHKVEFILMGGAAMAYHELRNAPDDFADLDILINPTRSNAARFADAMNAAASASGRMVTQKFDPNLMAKQHAKFVPDRNELDCEFVAFLRPSSFIEALARTESPSISFVRVPVMALRDLLTRKNEAIADHKKHLDEIAENVGALRRSDAAGGSLDFSALGNQRISTVAKRFLDLLTEANINPVFFGSECLANGEIIRLKWLFPLEVFLPCDDLSADLIKSALQRSMGLNNAAAQGSVIPGGQFSLGEDEDIMHCRLADTSEEFAQTAHRATSGTFLGKPALMGNASLLDGIFAKMSNDALQSLAKNEREAERIGAKLNAAK